MSEVLKFKCKGDFSWAGMPMSERKVDDTSADVVFFSDGNWIKDHIYEGHHYQGGCMCPGSAYVITAENGNQYYFSVYDMKPSFMLFSDHFNLIY